MFGQMAKWVAQIDQAERIPEFVARAFATATSGRAGPVVLALPEDMLSEAAVAREAQRYIPVQAHPAAADVARLKDLLQAARRPFVLLGGGGWTDEAVAQVQRFAEAWDLPVGASFRCQDRFDNGNDNYAGDVAIGVNPKLAQRVRKADLLLVLGARLGEITTGGYSLLESPRPRQSLIHVHAGAEELGRVYQPSLAINAGMPAMAAALAELRPDPPPAWGKRTRQARADYLAWTEPPETPGALQMGAVMAFLRERLPPEAILCNGAGNYTVWPNRFYRYRRYGTLLGPTSGSMGYGTPAAVAAKRLHPERPVIAFAGDGCFLMNGQELATAVQYGLNIVVLVVNNGMYGTIRMHQERHYPGRVSGTDLINPDFAKLAEAYGAHGAAVERTEDFEAAFERALAAGRPALIELRIDPEAITPDQTLSQIRAAAEAG
jgi:acetolactate synthase-1/2/3 large subunit